MRSDKHQIGKTVSEFLLQCKQAVKQGLMQLMQPAKD